MMPDFWMTWSWRRWLCLSASLPCSTWLLLMLHLAVALAFGRTLPTASLSLSEVSAAQSAPRLWEDWKLEKLGIGIYTTSFSVLVYILFHSKLFFSIGVSTPKNLFFYVSVFVFGLIYRYLRDIVLLCALNISSFLSDLNLWWLTNTGAARWFYVK